MKRKLKAPCTLHPTKGYRRVKAFTDYQQILEKIAIRDKRILINPAMYLLVPFMEQKV